MSEHYRSLRHFLADAPNDEFEDWLMSPDRRRAQSMDKGQFTLFAKRLGERHRRRRAQRVAA